MCCSSGSPLGRVFHVQMAHAGASGLCGRSENLQPQAPHAAFVLQDGCVWLERQHSHPEMEDGMAKLGSYGCQSWPKQVWGGSPSSNSEQWRAVLRIRRIRGQVQKSYCSRSLPIVSAVSQVLPASHGGQNSSVSSECLAWGCGRFGLCMIYCDFQLGLICPFMYKND